MPANVENIKEAKPNPLLVAHVERLLRDARAGTLQALCGVVIYNNGNSSDMWVNAPDGWPVHMHSDRMIGCIERIKFQLLTFRYNVETEDSFVNTEGDDSA